MTDSETNSIDFVHGVGGRLSAPKSPLYIETVARVEARANPFVARYMLVSDLAYVLTAVELGVTPKAEGVALVSCLLDLLPEADRLAYSGGDTDIVTLREAWVVDRIGQQLGSRLHVGRNRGESIRNILPRLFFRQALHDGRQALFRLITALHAKAGPLRDSRCPLYHHLQHASVTTAGEYLLSLASNLLPHLDRLAEADARTNVAPPAQTGRRENVEIAARVGRRLGFDHVQPLRQQLHMTEDHLIEPFFALTLLNVVLSRLCSDLRIWGSQEFSLFELADCHANGSSLLPQKKNPFGLQMVIGGASVSTGRLAAQLASAIAPAEQLDSIFPAGSLYMQARDIVGWTKFVAEVIEEGEFREAEMANKATHGGVGASEALDILVFEHGVPMRIAHHVLGAWVRADQSGGTVDIHAEFERELGQPLDVDNGRLERILRGQDVPETMIAFEAIHHQYDVVADELVRRRDAVMAESAVQTSLAAVIEEAEAFAES